MASRLSPPSLATLAPPKGKVLVVVDDAIVALDLQRLLRDAGYRVVGPATTVADIQRMIQRDDIDCAILDLDVDRRAPLPIADLLAFADVPFVYLTTGVFGAVPWRHRHRPVVEKPFTREILIAAIEKAMAKRREVANGNRWSATGSVVPGTRIYPPI
jgi:CheY-like chemotaxis protein